MLKPQDIVVALKLAAIEGAPWTYLRLADALGMNPSAIHQSVQRLGVAGLVEPGTHAVRQSALLEFLTYGLRYVFPPSRGPQARGMLTGPNAPVFEGRLALSESSSVWPTAEGGARGDSLEPLHPLVPRAAARDERLYALLAAVDALRIGTAREREVAGAVLRELLKQEPLKVASTTSAPSDAKRSLAEKLLAEVHPKISTPKRTISVVPYSAPSIVLERSTLIDVMSGRHFSEPLANKLAISYFDSMQPRTERRAEGLLWPSNEVQRFKSGAAVGFDGSLVLTSELWETDYQGGQFGFRDDYVGVATCIDWLLFAAYMSNAVLKHAALRRPTTLTMTLDGVKGRRLGYEHDHASLEQRRCDEDIVVFRTKLPTDAFPAKAEELVSDMLRELGYYFGEVNAEFARRRTDAALRLLGV